MKWYNYKKKKPEENIIILARKKSWISTYSIIKNYTGIRTGYYQDGVFIAEGYGIEDPDEWTYIYESEMSFDYEMVGLNKLNSESIDKFNSGYIQLHYPFEYESMYNRFLKNDIYS